MLRSRGTALFWVPAAVVLAALAGWPLLRTLYFSLTDASLNDLSSAHWVGLINMARLLRDPDWWQAVVNTTVFAVVSVTAETIFGLGLAVLLDAPQPGRALLRAIVLVPWAIPTVVSAKMWAWIFNDHFGFVNTVLRDVGGIQNPPAWLANDTLAMGVAIFVDVWKTTPFMAILFLTALQGIPSNVREAAVLDGVPPLRRFWYITLPFLRPILVVGVLFRMLDALRVFDVIYVLTSNSRNVATMSIYARQQLMGFQDAGYGSAASVATVMTIAVLTGVFLLVARCRRGATA